jgi:hypothetical protein
MKHGDTRRIVRRILLSIIVLQIVVQTLAMLTAPLFEYDTDETGHFGLVRFIAVNKRLPGPDDYASAPPVSQYTQPPLYHLLATPLIWALDSGAAPIPGQRLPLPYCSGANTNVVNWARPPQFNIIESDSVRAGYALRLLNLIFALIGTLSVYYAVLCLLPGRWDTAATAAALFAFTPYLVRTTALLSNDTLNITWGALAMYVAAKYIASQRISRAELVDTRHTWWLLVGIALLTVCCLLTKVTGWAICVTTVLLVASPFIKPGTLGRALKWIVIAGLVIGMLLAGLMIFNTVQYGSPIGRYELRFRQAFSWDVFRVTLSDMWGSIMMGGRFSQIRESGILGLATAYTLTFWILGIGLTLLIMRWLRGKHREALTLALLTLAFLVPALALVLIRSVTSSSDLDLIFAPFRYMGHAIPAVVALAALGLTSYPVLIKRPLIMLVTAIWLVVSVIMAVTVPAYAIEQQATLSMQEWSRQSMDNVVPVSDPQVGAPFKVIGYRTTLPMLHGQDLRITFYLTAGENNQSDAVYALQTQLGTGEPCVTFPASGVVTNATIQSGQVIQHHVDIPYCSDTVADALSLSVSWRRAQPDGNGIEAVNSTALLPLGTIKAPDLPKSIRCMKNLGTIDEAMRIVYIRLPATLSTTQPFIPSVDWWVIKSIVADYTRVYQLHDAEGDVIAQCSGRPRKGHYSTKRWQSGEYVPLDDCIMDVAHVPHGKTYSVWVGMKDSNGSWLASDWGSLIKIGDVQVGS